MKSTFSSPKALRFIASRQMTSYMILNNLNSTVRLLTFICLLLRVIPMSAQEVNDVRAEQNANDIIIHYNLTSTGNRIIDLFVSENNGKSWQGPLQRVSGDVGQGIQPGSHSIIWNVLEEKEELVGDQIKFRISASGRTGKVSVTADGYMKLKTESNTYDLGAREATTIQLPVGVNKVEIAYKDGAKWRTAKRKIKVDPQEINTVRYTTSGLSFGRLLLKLTFYGGIIGAAYVLSDSSETGQ